jgi:hypothetical protein
VCVSVCLQYSASGFLLHNIVQNSQYALYICKLAQICMHVWNLMILYCCVVLFCFLLVIYSLRCRMVLLTDIWHGMCLMVYWDRSMSWRWDILRLWTKDSLVMYRVAVSVLNIVNVMDSQKGVIDQFGSCLTSCYERTNMLQNVTQGLGIGHDSLTT